MSERYVIEIQELGSTEMIPIWETMGGGEVAPMERALTMQSLLPVDIREFTQVVRISEEREVVS